MEIDFKIKLPSEKNCNWEMIMFHETNNAEDSADGVVVADSQLQVGKLTSGNYMIRAFPNFEEEQIRFDYFCEGAEIAEKSFTIWASLC